MSRSKAVRRGAGALALTLAIAACGLIRGFHLSASSLDIGPSPAMPGDSVIAVFHVNVAPRQPLTIILTINEMEHLRETGRDAPDGPYVIALGDAADLIAKYGTGTHSARIEVLAEEDNERARTQSVGFELRNAAP